jgi:hypothetical protein
MKIWFLEPARAELEEAVGYYEGQRVGSSAAVVVSLANLVRDPVELAGVRGGKEDSRSKGRTRNRPPQAGISETVAGS